MGVALVPDRDTSPPPARQRGASVPSLDELYEAHVDDVARWVSRLYGPGPEVEDLVHDVFCHAARQLAGFRGESKITTWLFAIARHTVAKRRSRERLRRLIFGHRKLPAEFVHAVRADGPHDALTIRHDLERLYAALDELPEKYRTPLVLFEIEELPAERIAEMLEITPNTVWVRLHRARQRVHEAFARAEAGGVRQKS